MILLITLCIFTPRLQLFSNPLDGTYEWTRGITFAQQTENPFESPREVAMRWRAFPAIICWSFGLRGYSAFVFPWIGIALLLIYTQKVLRRHVAAPELQWAGFLLVCASSAVLVPVHWLGINDAWYLLGLLIVTFTRERKWLALAILIFPLFDERFIIGLPLAYVVRYLSLKNGEKLYPHFALILLPYIIARLSLSPFGLDSDEAHFVQRHFQDAVNHLAYIPHGWWMGFRIGWLFLLASIWFAYRSHGKWMSLLLFCGICCTAMATTLLAWDISKSIAILIPVLLFGFISVANWERWKGDVLTVCVFSLFILLIPAQHVIGYKLHPIETLPIELMRWLT